MICKRHWYTSLAILLVLYCLCVPAIAVSEDEVTFMEDLPHEAVTEPVFVWNNPGITRVTRSLNINVAAGRLSVSSDKFSLEVGDTVAFNCSYSPSAASVDYGVIAPDGYFYCYKGVTGGRLNKTIRVSQRGTYSLAIRNNTLSTVSVSGFVTY